MRDKIYPTFDRAIVDIPCGASVMLCWWSFGSSCNNLTRALLRKGTNKLTCITINTGSANLGSIRMKPDWKDYQDAWPYLLLRNHQIEKLIVTWGMSMDDENPLNEMILSGEVAVEVVPLGTLAERIRCAGAGLHGFYTTTGVGTTYEHGKETKVIGGERCILELPLRADYGFVRAHRADTLGNLTYKGMSRGMNPLIAAACSVTIAEVDEIVPVGELDPELVVTSGIYIDRIVQVPGGARQ